MKNVLLLFLALAAVFTVPAGAEDAGYPEAKHELALAVPEGWKTRYEDDKLYVTTTDELSVVIEVSGLKATKKEGSAALAEMKNQVNEAFKNVTFDAMEQGGGANVGFYILNGKGEDDEGEVIINALMVTNGDNDKVYFVFVAASPEGAKEHGEDIAKVIGSIRKVD